MLYADLIFFAVVAAVILLKLRSILGKEDEAGNAMKNASNSAASKPKTSQKKPAPNAKVIDISSGDVIEIDEQKLAEEAFLSDAKLAETFVKMRTYDNTLYAQDFIEGAKMAYEMVTGAFAAGDKVTLKSLMSKEVYAEFEKQIDEFKKKGHTLSTIIVSINDAKITSARLNKSSAIIEVEFASDEIEVTRDKTGEVIDGDPKEVFEQKDIWVLERNLRSNDPNWTIIET